MALALVLRNASRNTGRGLPRNFLNSTSVIVCRDFSSSVCQKQYSPQLNLTLVQQNKILSSPQIRLMSGDHSKLWPIEKALSLSLVALVPAAVAAPNIIFDNLLAIAAVAHYHWGLEGVVVDYVRPIVVGNILPKLTLGLLYIISATTLGGLLYYNMNEIGIGKTIRQFWAIKKEEGQEPAAADQKSNKR